MSWIHRVLNTNYRISEREMRAMRVRDEKEK
jgi:hypothetical protein